MTIVKGAGRRNRHRDCAERLAIIADEESRRDTDTHMKRLSAVSEKMDKLQGALKRPIDPQLAHYLQRRSYDKTLEFLEQL